MQMKRKRGERKEGEKTMLWVLLLQMSDWLGSRVLYQAPVPFQNLNLTQ